ncbi:MAG: cytochrome c biogenesis protein CcsA [Tannerella sp.]|jgi:cytochrome c-type biogenesis protein CcsB|nr:cytochrome c biogenesis protein CcsA [Tannerella sp.]
MRKLPFILLMAMIAVLATATFAERQYGSSFVMRSFYGSWWMITLWAALLVSALGLVFQRLRKNLPALLLHCAFGLILVGAITTFITSKRGQIHLRENSPAESDMELPFAVTLDKFEIEYYKGTTTPADYISRLSVFDGDRTFEAVVSMNNVFNYRSFRFYQASFDSDLKGTILSVNYDPYGIIITYSGYLLLALSMIWLLLSKYGDFRKLIKSLTIMSLAIAPVFASAQRTLSKEEAKVFGRLSMFYNGRIVPVDTYARDFTLKITGKSSYRDFNAVQTLAGWLFFPDDWQEEQMIKIKSTEIRQFVGDNQNSSNRLRLSDFFNAGIFKPTYADFPPQHKGVREAEEKLSLMISQHSGYSMTIFPHGNKWFSSADDLTDAPPDDTLFISKILIMLGETLEREDHAAALNLIDKISLYQQKRAEKNAISPAKTSLEIIYNKLDAAGILFKINITFGALLFAVFIRSFLTGRKKKFFRMFSLVLTILSLTFLSLSIGLRWYVSSHIPLSNGYETMVFISWFIMISSVLFGRKSDFSLSIGLILSGLALLVASLGKMNPGITQLVPVLQSPWLSIHVSLIMISYSLAGFMTFNGITALILHFISKNSDEFVRRLYILSRIILYPALFTLSVGIFIGAVWANVSWGRYWGWDPKEVWALITMLVYSLAMHSRSLKIFGKPLFFHVFSIVAFLAIIMTYFGVSMFFGGMHSY